MGNPPSSWRLRGHRGLCRAGTGMAGPGSSAEAAAASSRLLAPLLPLLAPLLDAMDRTGSLQCPPAPLWTFEEPWGGSRSLRRGEAGRRGREGTGFREAARWGRPGPDQCSIPWTAVSPRDSGRRRPRAHTRAQRLARPRSTLRLQAAPLPGLRAHTHTTCTLPGLSGTPDPQGRARRAKAPRGPHTCAHTLTYTHTQTTGPPRSAHCPDTAPPPLAPTASPRLHADASERDGRRLDARPQDSQRRPRAGRWAPLPAGRPLRAPAPEPGRRPSPPRTPSPRQRARPLRPALTVGHAAAAAAAAAAARAPARPRRCLPAGPRRRRQRQGRSGRPLVLGPPSRRQKPPSSRI